MTQILDQYGKPIIRKLDQRQLAELATTIKARYDAAQTPNEFINYWANADHFDADSAHSKGVRQTLVSRSRYEITSNGYADGIAQTYSTDLVGVGPQLRMQTASAAFNQLVERTFYDWSLTTGLRRKLWCMAHAKHVDGEAFAVLRRNPRVQHRIKLDVVLHETEQCQTPYVPIDEPNYIDGIKFDEFGNPLWYDFLHQHPGMSSGLSFDMETERVPADMVLHWFKLRRPGQHRGVPECASTLNLGAAFRRLREANLSTAEKVAAWTLFLKTMFQPNELDEAAPFSTQDIVHGMMTALPNSMEPFQLKAEHPGPTYETFHRSLLSEQARPKCMSYNKAACDSKDSNYASGRLDFLPYYGTLDVDRGDCNDLVLAPLFSAWFELAVPNYGWLGGDIRAVTSISRYHIWDWPKHQIADVEAEANANRTKLESGQVFIHRLFSDAGLDFEDEAQAAATAMGVDVNTLKQRLFDVLFPPPKQLTAKPSLEPAMQAVFDRAFQLPAKVNGNGAHHG